MPFDNRDDELHNPPGKGDAFSNLYNQYAQTIYFFAWKQTGSKEAAEDITSDTFLRVWKRYGDLAQHSKIKPYLFQVTRNACIDYYHQQQKEKKENGQLRYLNGDHHQEPALQDIIRLEFIQEVYSALRQLPPQCQKIFKSLFVEGKNYEQIASEMNITEGTVRAQKVRGLKLLRKRLGMMVRMMVVMLGVAAGAVIF